MRFMPSPDACMQGGWQEEGLRGRERVLASLRCVGEHAGHAHAGGHCTVAARERETLVERVRSVRRMPWGVNTNFQAVFDLLLSRTRQFQLDLADMVQRLHVFSDMQFDEAGEASGADWETDHQAIMRKFTAAGYPVPQIVYGNLKGYSCENSTPVLASEDGVALVSGFSKGMLLTVFEGKGITPMIVLEEAIKGSLFELTQVVD
ncbi:unnamed protein product [Closterium sp. Naga37s-1]|nr:unnamed protein product [Closterium sp. Naga37s-1]